jgi:enterochelin esterase-like enzyme
MRELASKCIAFACSRGLMLTTLPLPPNHQPSHPSTARHRDGRGLDKLESKHVAPRYVDVWLPPGYSLPKAKRHRYPVIYVHDGQNLFDPASSFIGVDWGIDETMTRLIGEKKIPEAIIVAVWNTPKRLSEYMPQKPLEQLA